MALTYRSEKGSALTNTELDNNFRHFTGSQTIAGDVTVSGSLGVASGVNITGSSVIVANLPTNEAGVAIGGMWLSGSTGVGSKYLVVKVS